MASLGRAEAGLLSISLQVERYRDLLADKAVSQQEYDDALVAMKSGTGGYSVLEGRRLKLPVSILGYTRVTARHFRPYRQIQCYRRSALVTAYQPMALATIQQLDPIYVDVPQSTAEMLRLKRRMEDGRLNQDGPESE